MINLSIDFLEMQYRILSPIIIQMWAMRLALR
jgi:hypothetical protein